jgi:SAM-dependent methyltransferase
MPECLICKIQNVADQEAAGQKTGGQGTGGESAAGHWTAHEKMFGTGEAFKYFECADCGCVQIEEVPKDLAKYYPSSYYSQGHLQLDRKPSIFRKVKYNLLGKFFVPARSSLGKALGYKEFFNWLGVAGVKADAKILDFGSGSGHLLKELYEHGFTNLLGVDPFLPKSIQYAPGFAVRSQSLESLEERFDVIMSHHSFEHVANPREIFSQFYQKLNPGGVLILRIPYLGWAWKHYGTDWVSLDAPRHLFHITDKGIELLCKETGLQLEKQFWDSFAFQFWASEQYREGISLFAENSYGQNSDKSQFSRIQIKEFGARAERLNREKSGDQVCYILRKPLSNASNQG